MPNPPRAAQPPARAWIWASLLLMFSLLGAPLRAQAAGAARTIVVGLDNDYPPYEFINPQGKPDGYTVDLIQTISRVMGLNLELRPGIWEERRRDLEAGRIQILTTMFKSPERERLFDFCDPSLTVHYSIFVRKSAAMPRQLEDLRGRKVLVQRGSLPLEHLLTHGFQDTAVPVDSELDALRQLASGKQDAAIVAHPTGLMFIRQGGVGNIQPVGEPALSLELCFVVAKGNPGLRDRLNTGLAILRHTGEFDAIHAKWFGGLESPDPRSLKTLRTLALVVLALFVLLAGTLLWNRILRQRILQRTRELRASKDFLQAVIDSLPLMLFAKDPNQGFTFSIWNRKAEEMTGHQAKDILGTTDLDHFPPEQAQAFKNADQEVMRQGELRIIDEEFLDTTKGRLLLRTMKVPLRDPEGNPFQLLGISEDITERKRVEQALAQFQRLESLGVLAGGVAHDFNNYLMAIQGNLDLAADELPPGHPARTFFESAGTSIRLASNLANQMLAYSGKGACMIRPLNLNELITSMEGLLTATLPQQVGLRLELDEAPPLVRADERQVQQMLLNLVINASEAIGERPGSLKVSTFQERLEATTLPSRFPGQSVEPGLFAVIQVEDDGCGMGPDILSHLFEPFFSSKFTGRGLGLSAIQGILKGHKGAIQVLSQPRLGSIFRIFLPAAADNG